MGIRGLMGAGFMGGLFGAAMYKVQFSLMGGHWLFLNFC